MDNLCFRNFLQLCLWGYVAKVAMSQQDSGRSRRLLQPPPLRLVPLGTAHYGTSMKGVFKVFQKET